MSSAGIVAFDDENPARPQVELQAVVPHSVRFSGPRPPLPPLDKPRTPLNTGYSNGMGPGGGPGRGPPPYSGGGSRPGTPGLHGKKLKLQRPAFGQQLKAMIKKNMIVKWRHKFQLVMRFFVPILMVSILSLLKVSDRELTERLGQGIAMEPCEYDMAQPYVYALLTERSGGFDPKKVLDDLQWIDDRTQVIYVDDKQAMYGNLSKTLGGAGLEFHEIENLEGGKPKVSYTLTLGMTPATFCVKGDKNECHRTFYFMAGYTCLQHQLNVALLKAMTKPHAEGGDEEADDEEGIISEIEEVPLVYPPTSGDAPIIGIFPTLITMGFISYVSALTSALIDEKTNKTREILLVMGLRKLVHWQAWFINEFLLFAAIVAVTCFYLFYLNIFDSFNVALEAFVLLQTFCFSLLAVCGILASGMNDEKIAGIVAMVVGTVMMVPYFFVSLSGQEASMSKVLTASLSSPSAVLYGLEHLIKSRYRSFPEVYICFPIYLAAGMIILDTVIYIGIVSFLERASLIGGEKDWFWFLGGQNKKIRSAQNSSQDTTYMDGDPNMEPVAPEFRSKSAIQCRGITKVFGTNIAVNKLNIDIYEGQITAVLGHNGAGKSTLISMVVGMATVSDGTAYVYGNNIIDPKDMNAIRSFIGVCLQEDVLFPEMTIIEHLRFYGEMKGLTKEETERQARELIDLSKLHKVENSRAKSLSGGEKRKLSIANALIGDPKVVILDEPSSAVDAFSRQEIWHILRTKKANRVIILTTHFMDEADVLADRKAIISTGRVKCIGSSLFLKNRFGVGYHLVVDRDPSGDPQQIVQLITGHMPNATMQRTTKLELHFSLPWEKSAAFPALFQALEARSSNSALGPKLLNSFAVSVTTLEEVFMKITQESNGLIEENEQAAIANGQPNRKKKPAPNPSTSVSLPSLSSARRSISFVSQVSSLIRVRFLLTLRRPGHLFGAYVFPALILCMQLWSLRGGSLDMVGLEPPPNDTKKAVETDPLVYSCVLNPSMSTSAFSSKTLDLRYGVHPEERNQAFNQLLLTLDQTITKSVNLRNMSFDEDCIAYPNRRNMTMVVPATSYGKGFKLDVVLDGLYAGDYPLAIDWLINIHTAALQHPPRGEFDPNVKVPVITSNAQSLECQFFEEVVEEEQPRHHVPSFAFFANMNLIIGMILMFVWMPTYLGSEVVEDRQDGVRSYLKATGVFPSAYWVAMHLSHLFWCVVGTAVILIVHVTFIHLPYVNYEGPFMLFLWSTFLYFNAALLFVYIVTFLFSTKEFARSVLPLVTFFATLVGFLIWMLSYNTDLHYLEITQQGKELSMYLSAEQFESLLNGVDFMEKSIWSAPFLALAYNFAFIFTAAHRELSFFMGTEKFEVTTYWSNNTQWVASSLMVMIVVYSFLLGLFDTIYTGGSLQSFFGINATPSAENELYDARDDDEDVVKERDRAKLLAAENQGNSLHAIPLLMAGLRKSYATKLKKLTCGMIGGDEKIAVANVDLVVEQNEILGFLGPNGAGKTSCMRAITGEVLPTRGVVRIDGLDVARSGASSFQVLGYCPQLDPLWKAVTVREHLLIHGKIKGIEQSLIPQVADLLIKELEIEKHAGKRASDISGGTKRKLAFAIALIGNPKLLLLDEPSTGLDPLSKRYMWRSIINFIEERAVGSEIDTSETRHTRSAEARAQNGANGRGPRNVHSAILTTHSMEEAEFLCSRIGIMVNGAMRCIGSIQHLNTKYGGGYYLDLKWDLNEVSHNFVEQLLGVVGQLFGSPDQGYQIKERLGDRMTIFVPPDSLPTLSRVFSTLEQAKQSMPGFEEYSFSQGSFEKVFLFFAKQQLGSE